MSQAGEWEGLLVAIKETSEITSLNEDTVNSASSASLLRPPDVRGLQNSQAGLVREAHCLSVHLSSPSAGARGIGMP